jgi:polysaccharide export outer membrane protein
LKRILGALCAASGLMLVSCATDSAIYETTPPDSRNASSTYTLGPPDRLRIVVLPDPAIEREVTVRPDGIISIDLVGDVPAAGRTTEEVARDIESRILRFKRNASVTVSLQTSASPQLTMLGEVARPSTFPLTSDTNVIKAIGLAGGVTRMAAKDRIRLIRTDEDQPRVYRVDLEAIERGDYATNYPLRGGDVLVVLPTGSASAGYMIQRIFFPLQQILGFGANVATTVYSGGASQAF